MTVHPNSLANLRPPWEKGYAPNPTGNPAPGPKIAPALHKYASWSYTELAALAHDPERADKLPIADVIAITSLLKAAQEVAWGDQARQFVAERLDGSVAKGDVHIGDRNIFVFEVVAPDGHGDIPQLG